MRGRLIWESEDGKDFWLCYCVPALIISMISIGFGVNAIVNSFPNQSYFYPSIIIISCLTLAVIFGKKSYEEHKDTLSLIVICGLLASALLFSFALYDQISHADNQYKLEHEAFAQKSCEEIRDFIITEAPVSDEKMQVFHAKCL